MRIEFAVSNTAALPKLIDVPDTVPTMAVPHLSYRHLDNQLLPFDCQSIDSHACMLSRGAFKYDCCAKTN